MAHDPRIRDTGQVFDIDGQLLDVGVDYDTVTLGEPGQPGKRWRFTRAQVEELAQLIVAASWEAADCAGRMAAEI
jgi:hypothetical protein